MFTKKMMTRFAQIAPLALAASFSLSPALARAVDKGRPDHHKVPAFSIVTLTPANGWHPSTTIGSASAASTWNGRRLDPSGGTSGSTRVHGGATPGGNNGNGLARVSVGGSRDESRRIEVDALAGPPSAGITEAERAGIEVDVDNGSYPRARRLVPRLETDGAVVGSDGGIPVGDLMVEETMMTAGKAARAAARIPQVLLPKIGQAPIAASAPALGRTRFGVELNGENGLAASATFTFGRH